MKFSCQLTIIFSLASWVHSQSPKEAQLQPLLVNDSLQIETTNNGAQANTTYSLRAGPRGFVLLEDTTARKKIQHFDRERQPERVVHALGHGAYGTFESYGDWSNLTSACWLQAGAVSDTFTRFSVVVAGTGGSEVGRDTHGFATKIYSKCGNQDLVGNHLSSFFINDGILFPDLIHAVKAEPDKGFPTGGTAHDTAYDFFTQRPEGTFQVLNVLSDLGIPRDVRHISGNGVHTFRFINDQGNSTLFKWYWLPVLGHRSLVYDEATKIAGKNNNFQRVDLYNAIEAGNYPEYEFMVQIFPDDGSYMYKGIDLLDSTMIIPYELNPPVKLGKLTLNRNPTNFFSEAESIGFAPSNVVKGITFVPDPLLQWRLMSYDDTLNHRHGSPNHYLLPVNRPIAPVNNNYRDGYMQPFIYEGESISSPNNLDGIIGASPSDDLPYGQEVVDGKIGRYGIFNDVWTQARVFWANLNPYAQQHTIDALRFELGHVATLSVKTNYVNKILNNVDNCLARRVAYGLGIDMPALGSGPTASTNVSYPSLYPLVAPCNMSVVGLAIGILADDTTLSAADYNVLSSLFDNAKLTFEVVAPHMGMLKTGVIANQSYITTSSIFYDAVIVGSNAATNVSTANGMYVENFLQEAYGHGKPIGAIGNGKKWLSKLGYAPSKDMGVFEAGSGSEIGNSIIQALMIPGRYPQRAPLDDPSICT